MALNFEKQAQELGFESVKDALEKNLELFSSDDQVKIKKLIAE